MLKPALDEDPSLANLSHRDMLNKVITLESAQDLERTTMVMQEAMRYRPAVALGQLYFPKKDVTLGKTRQYNLRKNDVIVINIEAIHHDPSQWQRPTEFLPERFDHTDPLSLTPDGKKRHVNSYIPFHGGSRVCFGKTLAEIELKVLITFLTQKFDFSYEEESKYETEIAFAQVNQSDTPPIWLKLT